MKPWQVMLGGALSMIGTAMVAVPEPKIQAAGQIVAGIGGLIGGTLGAAQSIRNRRERLDDPAPVEDHSINQ